MRKPKTSYPDILSNILRIPSVRRTCSFVFLWLCVFTPFFSGCESAEPNPAPVTYVLNGQVSAYGPAKIVIIPFTEFARTEKDHLQLKVYVDLVDAFGSRIKTPGVFRFELYEYVPRLPDPKGQRITVWPEVHLTDATANNNHWRDFLRAYEFIFDMDFQPATNSKFVIQANCLCPDQKRLTADFVVQYK